MKFVGIDPGVTGAIALLDDSDGSASVIDMPRDSDGVDGHQVYALLRVWEPAEVYIERTHTMPKGGTANFVQGDTRGSLRTAVHIAKVPLIWVTPRSWQQAMSLWAGPYTDIQRKARSRARAQELFPRLADQLGRAKDHNRAEALLIAEYGRRTSLTKAVVG